MNRALLLIAGWVGRATAVALASLRRPLASEVAALHERLEKLREENELLRARLDRIDSRRRPHWEPWERLRILLHRARYGMSVDATARAFVVTGQTVLHWLREVESGVSRVVRTRAPLNALPDLVGEIARYLKRQWPRWGTRRIAGILANLGMKGSRTSVQRVLRQPPPRGRDRRHGRASSIRARHVGHAWVVDFTVVRSFFRSIVVGAVLDAWTRKVVALRAWGSEPDGKAACLLVRDALRGSAGPTWVVSDRGTQFTSTRFRSFLARHGIRRRYSGVGDANLARLDRFWRSMKEEYARGLFLFRPVPILERQLRDYVRWHGIGRPHQGLGQRLPADIHDGARKRRVRRVDRGLLEVACIGGDSRLPLFRLHPTA